MKTSDSHNLIKTSTPATSDSICGRCASSAWREVELGGAALATIPGAAKDAAKDWPTTLCEVGLSAGMTLAMSRASKIPFLAPYIQRVVLPALVLPMIRDIGLNGKQVLNAGLDTWQSDKNWDQNVATMRQSVGRFVVDTGLSLLASGGTERFVSGKNCLPAEISKGIIEKHTNTELTYVPPVAELHWDSDLKDVARQFGDNKIAIPSCALQNKDVVRVTKIVDKDSPEAQVYEQVSPSVLALKWENGKEWGKGTCFAIETGLNDGHTYLASAHHTVSRSAGGKIGLLEATLPSGEKIPLNVIARDISAEVSLLRSTVPLSSIPSLKLGWSNDLSKWDHVAAFGFPAGANKVVMTNGEWVGSEATSASTSWEPLAPFLPTATFQTARHTSNLRTLVGNSGGPLIKFAGPLGNIPEVVGVHSSGIVGSETSFDTAVEHLRLLVESVRGKEIPVGGLQVFSTASVWAPKTKVEAIELKISEGRTITKPNS